jgi:hypothetical protein
VAEPRIRKAKGGVNSALVDPEAGKRLALAAQAAGLGSVAALADLLVDSGAIALPPEGDGVTETYTIEDLGVQMHSQMPPTERAAWFLELVETQQVALVTLLRARGYSSIVIARDFGMTELTVNKIYSRYADDLGAQVINVRLNTLVGNLQLAAERAGEGAMEKQDWGTYWRIQKEMIALLQSLGIVKQAIRKVEVAHKFDDQKQAELDDMLDLERMKQRRFEELKRVDATVTDAVPQLTLPSAGSMEEPYVEDD